MQNCMVDLDAKSAKRMQGHISAMIWFSDMKPENYVYEQVLREQKKNM